MRTETPSPVGARHDALLPREVDDRELFALLERSAEPVVLEGYHEGWDQPWRALSAEDWRTLSRELDERLHMAVVETQRSRGTAVRFGLEVIPTVLVFLHGEVVARLTGRVLVQDVIEAVRAARRQAWTRESSALELEALTAAHEPFSAARSFFRRRSNEHPLARV